MKRTRLEDRNVDVCVSIDVKVIFMDKAGGEIEEELERLEFSRAVRNIGVQHEDALARDIIREVRERFPHGKGE